MMDEWQLVRSVLLRIREHIAPVSPEAWALREWIGRHQQWLGVDPDDDDDVWASLKQATRRRKVARGPSATLASIVRELCAALALDGFDARLFEAMVASDRLSRLSSLLTLVAKQGVDLPALIGELAGAEPRAAAKAVRHSPVLQFGLVSFKANRQGTVAVEISWRLERLLDNAPTLPDAMVDLLIGPRQQAQLGLEDFEANPDVDLLARLLRGAISEHAEGINILIHGPPGTGKTELARTLAASAGAVLHAVGEANDEGNEPDRADRVASLHLAQRMLARHQGMILLFDEMEDLIAGAHRSDDDVFSRRSGSKLFVNRMIETNAVPVIWTTNAIGNVDPAILRRMSFVLKMGLPSRRQSERILAKAAAAEGVAVAPGFVRLLDTAPEAAMVLRVATRSGRLAGVEDGGVRVAESLVRALRRQEVLPPPEGVFDLALFESDPPLPLIIGNIVECGVLDVSLLLTGPPGTGKTALAHHLARALDRPLIVKRASDLLSRWVGGTEEAIAKAFAEARERQGVLLFDEVDSLLFDRATARTTWEVGQVNELLTWLDRHPLPVVAATNHGHKLDPAALRRFVFKIDLKPLGKAAQRRAFEHFFDRAAPADLDLVENLTPGDFAVVKRALRYRAGANAHSIVEALRFEAAAKPEHGSRIGFG